jgi:uncharacterized protein (DUF427 family)
MTEQLEEHDLIGHGQEHHKAVRIEPSARWVRAFFGARPIADSKRVLLVFEPRRLPVYYFSSVDVRMELLRPSDYSATGAGAASDRTRWTLESDGRTVPNAGWSYPTPDEERAPLKDHIAFYWDKLDAWFEEDQEVFVHPRDPYTRVDVMASSRHVKVVLDGQVIAETQRPHLLFETGLPTRYYLPALDVRLDLLEKERHHHPVPVQRSRGVLVRPRRWLGTQGCRVELPVPYPRLHEDRSANGVLQRKARYLCGWRAPAEADDQLVLNGPARPTRSGGLRGHSIKDTLAERILTKADVHRTLALKPVRRNQVLAASAVHRGPARVGDRQPHVARRPAAA